MMMLCCLGIPCDFSGHSCAIWFILNTVYSEKFCYESLVLNKTPQTELRE